MSSPKLSIEEKREKVAARPITGPYPALAREVRWLMGWNRGDRNRAFLSTRQAADATGVNHSTIAALTRGDRASERSLQQISDALLGDLQRLLFLAGYRMDESPARLRFVRARLLTLIGDDDHKLAGSARSLGISGDDLNQWLRNRIELPVATAVEATKVLASLEAAADADRLIISLS
jgi:transcriptional regulator with XRE-family HTH domain